MDLSIIIVNYNLTAEIDDCLNSIYKIITNLSIEILVIDNNSSDRTIEKLKEKYPQARFYFIGENLGYSKANNYGANESKSNYLLFLNPDTVLVENFAFNILKFLEDSKSAGACAPMLVYKDLTYQNSSGPKLGILYETAEAFLFISILRKVLKVLNRRKYKTGEPFHVNWVSGACLLISKPVYESVGGFNTEYFLNYEDIDLCNRVEKAGYRNYYFPGNRCIHLDQTSQKKNYESFVFSRYVSRLIYSKNNYGLIVSFIVRIVHLVGILFRLLLVNLMYRGDEKSQRSKGYRKAFKLYLGWKQ